jgi:hypothetical protein
MDDQTQQPEIPEQVIENVLKRVALILTKEDMETIQSLDREDSSGNATQYFLMGRVPNFEAIMQEEVKAYQATQNS